MNFFVVQRGLSSCRRHIVASSQIIDGAVFGTQFLTFLSYLAQIYFVSKKSCSLHVLSFTPLICSGDRRISLYSIQTEDNVAKLMFLRLRRVYTPYDDLQLCPDGELHNRGFNV